MQMIHARGLTRHFKVKGEVVEAVRGLDIDVEKMDANPVAPQSAHLCCRSGKGTVRRGLHPDLYPVWGYRLYRIGSSRTHGWYQYHATGCPIT